MFRALVSDPEKFDFLVYICSYFDNYHWVTLILKASLLSDFQMDLVTVNDIT